MSTTTIRLSEELRSQVREAAERAGTTPHAFILEAIQEKAEREAARADFHAEADERYAEIVATGKTIAWTDMRHYLEQRVAGKKVSRPMARKLAGK